MAYYKVTTDQNIDTTQHNPIHFIPGFAVQAAHVAARRRVWKIRKRCQGSGSRAKYVAAKRVYEDRLETGGAGKEFSANTEIQRSEPEW